jgi:hypothetical protein
MGNRDSFAQRGIPPLVGHHGIQRQEIADRCSAIAHCIPVHGKLPSSGLSDPANVRVLVVRPSPRRKVRPGAVLLSRSTHDC